MWSLIGVQMDSSGLQWTPGGLQVDSRKFSSNMTIFVESWWTPDGVHQIHQDYLESTWSMWSKVKYWKVAEPSVVFKPCTSIAALSQHVWTWLCLVRSCLLKTAKQRVACFTARRTLHNWYVLTWVYVHNSVLSSSTRIERCNSEKVDGRWRGNESLYNDIWWRYHNTCPGS